VKLWLQVLDSEGSTVSQFHSFTNRHGGVGSAKGGGWVKSREQETKGTREQGTEKQETERPGEGWGRETGGGCRRQGGGKNKGLRDWGTGGLGDQGTKGTRERGSGKMGAVNRGS
jgi:hypothetical protein